MCVCLPEEDNVELNFPYFSTSHKEMHALCNLWLACFLRLVSRVPSIRFPCWVVWFHDYRQQSLSVLSAFHFIGCVVSSFLLFHTVVLRSWFPCRQIFSGPGVVLGWRACTCPWGQEWDRACFRLFVGYLCCLCALLFCHFLTSSISWSLLSVVCIARIS